MMLTENQLRVLIRKQIITHNMLFENKEDSAIIQKADAAVDVAIDHIKSPIQSLMARETEELKKALEQEHGSLDEGDPVTFGLSLTLATPFLLKMIGKAAKIAAKAFGMVDKHIGGDTKMYEQKEEEWQAWWNEKSEGLHHFFMGLVEIPVGLLYKASKIDANDEQIKKTSELLFTVFIAYLLINSGLGLIKYLGKSSYGMAGVEGALTAVKGGEIGAYLRGALTRIMTGFGDSITSNANLTL